jgi:hypothetical protein
MLNNDFPSRGIGKDRLLAFYTSTTCGGYHSVPPPIMSTTPPAGASRERQYPDDSEHRRQCDNPCLAGGYDAPQVECAAWIPERNLTTPGRFLSRGRQRVRRLGGLDVEASERTRPHLHRANELLTEPGGTAADHVGATDAAIADLLIRAYDEDFVPPQRSAWLGLGPGVRKDVGVRVSPLAPGLSCDFVGFREQERAGWPQPHVRSAPPTCRASSTTASMTLSARKVSSDPAGWDGAREPIEEEATRPCIRFGDARFESAQHEMISPPERAPNGRRLTSPRRGSGRRVGRGRAGSAS